MSEPKIIQIVHVPSNEQHVDGLFALCENGEILAGNLGFVEGRLTVEWTHVPAINAVAS